MVDKVVDLGAAVADIPDGATIAVGGFGDAGSPSDLLQALAARAVRGLVVICNNAGGAHGGVAELFASGCVRQLICSYPRQRTPTVFDALWAAGKVGLQVVPQGTLVERLRCGAAGLGGFYTRTGVGTDLTAGQEVRSFEGRDYVLERPLLPDFAFVRGHAADRWGNVVYRKSARNLNPVMAAAARTTVAQVTSVVALGDLDPEAVVTPGVYVDRVVLVPA